MLDALSEGPLEDQTVLVVLDWSSDGRQAEQAGTRRNLHTALVEHDNGQLTFLGTSFDDELADLREVATSRADGCHRNGRYQGLWSLSRCNSASLPWESAHAVGWSGAGRSPMDSIPAPAQALLGSDAVTHAWTSNPDGSPQASVVCYRRPSGEKVEGASP